MPAPHPKEFRDDVVAVARKGEAPIAKLAADFGISESCLRNWLRQADLTRATCGAGRGLSRRLCWSGACDGAR